MFAATAWYYIREQASGIWSFSATGDPLTVFPALGIAFLGISIPLLLQGSEKYMVSAPNLRLILLLIPSAVLVTVSTGWLLTSELVTPAALWWDNYGFPLAWRVQLMRGCPPWCSLPSSETIINPLFFTIDCLFYLAIGYSIILAHRRISRRGSNLRLGAQGGRSSISAVGEADQIGYDDGKQESVGKMDNNRATSDPRATNPSTP